MSDIATTLITLAPSIAKLAAIWLPVLGVSLALSWGWERRVRRG